MPVALASRGTDGGYLACRGGSISGLLQADGRSPSDKAAMLQLLNNEDGSWSLRCTVNGVEMMACAAHDGESVLLAPKLTGELCTKWTLQGSIDASYTLQSWLTKRWLVGNASRVVTVSAKSYLHAEGSITEGRFVVDTEAHFDLTETHQ